MYCEHTDTLDALLAQSESALQAGHLHEIVDGLGRASSKARAHAAEHWPETVQVLRRSACFEAVQQDPLTRHSFSKPRGYAGDALRTTAYLYTRMVEAAVASAEHAADWGLAPEERLAQRPLDFSDSGLRSHAA